ncbi:hypothetical protein BGZ52_001514 [Haplosporangium bisporale]|nr:hypothetical protein BGZ52_001514 [Haplosporangium bisporale]KAF9210931.1 hypothetical protein BGZ59_008750 [Podila verticillata]KAI9233056.1 MAG: hypothetical protein BYD32DRAFT_426903 [Podila humilis]KFH71871.1 hypothetical protein MVEG_02165 [Podila verticillata NRRL 6337]
MKFTSILTLAAAVCAITAGAAPADTKPTTTLTKTTTKAKATSKTTTTTKAKATKTKAKTTTTKAKATTTKAKATTTKAKATKATTTTATTKVPTKTPTPPKEDPCSTFAKQAKTENSLLSFNAVRDCYLAQPYNAEVAAKTLTSLETLIGNFYVFLDAAKAATKAPFDTPRVDLMAGLRKIRATKWKSDYDFSMAVTYLTFSANDGHLAFRSECYRTASFQQPISLYAPVVGGSQQIRVFYADDTQTGVPKNSIVDCAVTTIDGVPALKAVQDFTDRTSQISKDPGVRLNDALASTSWYNDWLISPGGFAKRWEVPAKANMEYTIQCGTAAPQKLTVPWIVKPNPNYINYNTFTDTKTYWDVQCLAPASPYDNSRGHGGNSNSRNGKNVTIPEVDFVRQRTNSLAPATQVFRERGSIALPRGGRNGRNGAPAVITKAKEILLTATTAFYRLDKSDACVAVIASEEVAYFKFDASDYLQFIEGLKTLRNGGCKKLILDMTNNGGGSVDFAYFVNSVLFPATRPYFDEDLRSSTIAQGVAQAAGKMASANSIFDARGYNSVATRKPFKDATMFTKGINQARGGSTSTYTQRNFFDYSWPFIPMAKNETLPWKAADMAIVTNGFCGSACTMIATRFNVMNKVRTYAVGGIYKRPLSYFSFPGGFVMDNADIVKDIRKTGYKGKNLPSNLPVKASATIAVGEIYATEKTTVPLEYDTAHFSADVHLDQDAASARHPDNIWVKIAADFKK